MNDMGTVVAPGTVRIERVLPGPIERVWSYLVEPEKRAQWFAGGPMELVVGGKMELVFRHENLTDEPTPERFKPYASGWRSPAIVTRCEPPRVLAFTWGQGTDASEVAFELRSDGEDVVLTLTHTRLASRKDMVDVGSGWHLHLMFLGDVLRGHPRRPFWATQAELEKQYERQLPR
jgi:uncharacterized protein YndB with AHSA1/START domain